jgi:hypothetical protein
MAETEFSQRSIQLTKALTKEDKQSKGIFFTPKSIQTVLFQSIPSSFQPTSILEPSFGSGEFLDEARKRYPSATLHAVEKERTLYDTYPQKSPTIVCEDFLSYTGCTAGSLIIGNPPYFVTKEKNPACMTGRPNIYVAFLYKCVTQHLAPGGILAFILPSSILNSSYYEPMRRYIATKMTVLACKRVKGEFLDTDQETVLLTLLAREATGPQPSIFERNGCYYLSEHAAQLRALTEGTTTLSALGYSVKTGDVVWNQIAQVEGVPVQKTGAKSVQEGNLVAERSAEGAVPLYYSHNVKGGAIALDAKVRDPKKKQYIVGFKRPPMTAPAFLIQRGYGNTYKFDYAPVLSGPFYAENHLNVVYATAAGAAEAAGRIEKSFQDPRTRQFISWFIGNGGLSKTELENVLPIF